MNHSIFRVTLEYFRNSLIDGVCLKTIYKSKWITPPTVKIGMKECGFYYTFIYIWVTAFTMRALLLCSMQWLSLRDRHACINIIYYTVMAYIMHSGYVGTFWPYFIYTTGIKIKIKIFSFTLILATLKFLGFKSAKVSSRS